MRVIYKTEGFPILQNKVYSTHVEAINCRKGNISIVINNNNFIYNADFDPEKMVYDQEYDNSVPSNFFRAYYSRIIEYLIDKYKLDSSSLVLDIGCGKGTFLKQMFSEGKYDGRAIGIDPSYDGDLNPIPEKLSFIREYFAENHLDRVDKVNLVILRHTLEHIPNPSVFLSNIVNVLSRSSNELIPIFIEVPDVDWIFANKAYWDFFYEHVNYFSKRSLFETIQAAGATVSSIVNEFGNQYIWAEAIVNNGNCLLKSVDNEYNEVDYSLDFNEEIIKNISRKDKLTDPNSKLVIWGMASKGIIFSIHLIKNGHEPDFYVDINYTKQGKYLPVISKKILSPNNLPTDVKLTIICMNPNYITEVNEECQKLNINFELFTPDFKLIK
jgi:SAM-dependent methyltransferase